MLVDAGQSTSIDISVQPFFNMLYGDARRLCGLDGRVQKPAPLWEGVCLYLRPFTKRMCLGGERVSVSVCRGEGINFPFSLFVLFRRRCYAIFDIVVPRAAKLVGEFVLAASTGTH